MARSLSGNKENVEIISSKDNLQGLFDGIRLDCFAGDNLSKRDKIRCIIERIAAFGPDLIICSEPLALLASKRYKKRVKRKVTIVYDITEWYPSKKNLASCKKNLRWINFLKLLAFNVWCSKFADLFIFGEYYKSRPYRFLFPSKPYIFTPYYPDLKYINFKKPRLDRARIRLSYSGKISSEKGYFNFFNAVKYLCELNKNLKIDITIIGWYENPGDNKEFVKLFASDNPHISIKIYDKQDFRHFLEIINETDIFIDLRSDDIENQYCLPIKLFYYAAIGRPVIYSDLKSIRKEVEIDNFGFLTKPDDYQSVAHLINDYLINEDLYYRHCKNARAIAESKYNWQIAEPRFLKFITSSR
jgi:glycosyltransferase involved in cell wall biosynthesis